MTEDNVPVNPAKLDQTVPGDARDSVSVRVTWMSADRPFEANMAVSETLGAIRETAMKHFGLREEVVDGNQVRYYLYEGGTKITNLSDTVESHLHGRGSTVVFRLVRDLIAG